MKSRTITQFLFLVSIVMFGLLVPRLYAQEGASINGTVLDSSGAAVAGARLVLTNVATHETRQTASSSAGFFNFTGLSPATYTLSISAHSFRSLVMRRLVLSVSQQMTVHPVLEVGAAQQTVTVSGAPPAIATSTAAISQTVESRQIMNLPLNGRNALQLMALVPGVVQLGNGGQYGMTQMQFSTPGTRATDVNYMLDGGTNNDTFYDISSSYPNPDALQEFTTTTRSVSASLGRGSTAVQAVTKSGTNQFHGTAFEFVRNTDFDARSFFSSTRSVFKRNQFGGTLGGPILRNKLFFFFAYQGTITRGAPGVARYHTLTAAQRAGDFSSLSKPIIDPETGHPFPGNVIPTQRIQPFAQNLIKDYMPAGNQEAGTFYAFQPVSSQNANQFIWNFNYVPSVHDQVSFRYLLDNFPQKLGLASSLSAAQFSNLPARHQNWALGYTHIFTPNVINQLHLLYNRDAFGVTDPATNPQLDKLGLDVNTQAAISSYGLTPVSDISATGYFNLGVNSPTRDIMGNIELNDNVSWIHGIQSIQFGTQVYWNRINELQNYLTGGNMSFNGQVTGDGAADFLLGEFSRYQQLSGLVSHLHQTLASVFFEDDVRLLPRLTVNLGIRWDPFFGWTSETNQLSTFEAGQQSTVFPLALPGLLYPGDNHLPKSIVGNRMNNLAPRVGLAWDVHGNGKLAVRASFGMFYIPLTAGINLNRFTLIPPYNLNIVLSGGNAGDLWGSLPFSGVNPFPPPPASNLDALKKVPFTPTSSSTGFFLPFKTPVNQQWSLSIDQAIGSNSMIELAYLGSSGSHEFTSFQLNPAVYIPGQSTLSNIQQRRIYPYLGATEADGDVLSSNYNALEATYRKRYAHNLMVLSTYTWSRGLGVVGTEGAGGQGPRNPADWKMDYAPLSESFTGNWVTSFIWDIPYGSNLSSRALRGLAGGWQVNTINTVRSGAPFTILSGHDTALLGIGGETADLVGSPHLSNRTRTEFFNVAAYAQPATGTFGNVGINSMTGPVYWDTDLGLAKSFPLKENIHLKFRGEFYNVFNHTNFNNPNGTVSSPSFGTITGSGDPRVIELGAHLQF